MLSWRPGMLTAPNYALYPFFIYHMNISTKSSILLLNGPWPDKKCSNLLGSSEGTAACGIQQSFSSFFLKIGFSLREAPAVSESHTWESCKHYLVRAQAMKFGPAPVIRPPL